MFCAAGGERPLTDGERALVASVFGGAIDCDPVTIKRRKWFPFQPVGVTMAPMGHIHFHPRSPMYVDDFAAADLQRQALFVHEMTHVWQSQRKGRWYLPLMRHPLCTYRYTLKPGLPFSGYGIEQQAEIVRHAFLLERGVQVPGALSLLSYRSVLPFSAA